MKKIVAWHSIEKRGYHQVTLMISDENAMIVLHEATFEYTTKVAANKRLKELRETYNLTECNYPNNCTTFESYQ